MMRSARFLLSICFVAFAATPALAQMPGHGPDGFASPMPMMLLLRHADLTPDQQTKIDQIMKASFGEARPLMKQLRKLHEEFAARLLSAGPLQASNFSTLQKQETALRNELDTQMLGTALQVRAVLTPPQLSKLAQLHSKLEALHAQAEALLGDDEPPAPAE